jgi:hypothetical protein
MVLFGTWQIRTATLFKACNFVLFSCLGEHFGLPGSGSIDPFNPDTILSSILYEFCLTGWTGTGSSSDERAGAAVGAAAGAGAAPGAGAGGGAGAGVGGAGAGATGAPKRVATGASPAIAPRPKGTRLNIWVLNVFLRC